MEALIQVLESTIAARDPYTVGHQRRVTQIACTIGKAMGLSEGRLFELRLAGKLHDLGKIAIPASLLSKPGKLNTLEFALIKTHPQVAYNILEPINLPGNTTKIILQHHERLNGSGYPHGLKGDEILLEARILSVADVMEAMCSHRPYRAALGLGEGLNELTKNRGILYDEAVVDTCLQLYGPGLEDRREEITDLTSTSVGLADLPAPVEDAISAYDAITQVSAIPQVNKAQSRHKNKKSYSGHRTWMNLGSASIMGWLIVSSFKGY
jgi:HD-GYP domain-containing protein (c-di-GMP phosphodiesterase class II)